MKVAKAELTRKPLWRRWAVVLSTCDACEKQPGDFKKYPAAVGSSLELEKKPQNKTKKTGKIHLQIWYITQLEVQLSRNGDDK